MGIVGSMIVAKKLDELRESIAPKGPIYGAYWDKGSDPTLTRIHDAEGMEANVGLGGEWAKNDFDRAEIFGEIGPVTDELGNAFIRIPKLYIRKTKGPNHRTWEVSKHQYPGFYLPWCFWDFVKGRELPHVDVGKHLASLGDGNRLRSAPGEFPLNNTNIVQMRTYARNNNADGLSGYQQLDVHVYDILRTLMFIEFATLDMQSVMRGFADGVYSAYNPEISESGTNRIITTNARAGNFVVGQSVALGAAYNTASAESREILAIEPYDEDLSQIIFDGDPIDVSTDQEFSNRAWRTGWSSRIAASSGSFGSLSAGKYPCMYRGIESPYADLYQFVDGVNIQAWQTWVTHNADDYASNLFAHPYKQLGYVNGDIDGYVTEFGHDPAEPYAEFPVAVGGSASTYYSDYYYQGTGTYIACVGGYWSYGSYYGPSFWILYYPSSYANALIGGRLLKTPR